MHTSFAAVLTSVVGVAMLRIGYLKGQLKFRALRRRCPSCGRLLAPRGCQHCGY
jgi:hypothetical protein